MRYILKFQHNPSSMSNSMSNSTVTMSGGGGGGGGFPQIKTDMMYTHAAAAAAAGIPVSAGGGSPTSGLSNSRLHQVRARLRAVARNPETRGCHQGSNVHRIY